MSLKLTVWVAAGLLFFLTGCGVTTVVSRTDSVNASLKVKPTKTSIPESKIVLVATAILTPTPAPPSPTPVPTMTPGPMPIPTPNSPPFTYHTIGEGETLSYIAWFYDTEIENLVAMNKLSGASALIQVGQTLRVPLQVETTSPAKILLPDSEVVYGPAFVDFDIAGFISSQGGYLAYYSEYVDGQQLNGTEIIQRVSERFSVGPRLLLTLLEYYGGWVTNPSPSESQLRWPLGPRNPRGNNLYLALGFTANRINAGYYGYKRDGFWVFDLADYSQAITPQGINAGTVGVQNILAIHSDQAAWGQALSEEGLLATYQAFFGDPFAYAVEPLVPNNLTQPPLTLPWAKGQGFYLTAGPHAGYIDGSAWAAIDFGPPDVLGNCFYSNEPNTAAASGVVAVARHGEVLLDLDGDGNIQTGWVLLYLHVALDADTPVQVGQQVAQGDIIGYASCEGGLSNSSHLHFARRYNGEWMEAGGPVPIELSGWTVQPSLVPYEGIMKNGAQIREACECWEAEKNLIVNAVN